MFKLQKNTSVMSKTSFMNSPRATEIDDNTNTLFRHNSPSKATDNSLIEESYDEFIKINKNWKRWVTSQNF